MSVGQPSSITAALRRVRALTSMTAIGLFVAVMVPTILVPSRSDAASVNRAGIVVDFGNGNVQRIGVTFTGTASGLQVLSSAAPLQPTIRGFSGLGGAVCGIAPSPSQPSIGCPSDQNCLTCDAPRSWIYFRATAGSSGFIFSRAGAGSVSVHDGDIEGWRYGTGSTPPTFSDIESFFPPVTTTTARPTTTTTVVSTPTTRAGGSVTTTTTGAAIGPAGTTVPTELSNGSTTTSTDTASGSGLSPSTSTSAPLQPASGADATGNGDGNLPDVNATHSGDKLTAAGVRRGNTTTTAGTTSVPWPLLAFGALVAGAIATIIGLRRRTATHISGV